MQSLRDLMSGMINHLRNTYFKVIRSMSSPLMPAVKKRVLLLLVLPFALSAPVTAAECNRKIYEVVGKGQAIYEVQMRWNNDNSWLQCILREAKTNGLIMLKTLGDIHSLPGLYCGDKVLSESTISLSTNSTLESPSATLRNMHGGSPDGYIFTKNLESSFPFYAIKKLRKEACEIQNGINMVSQESLLFTYEIKGSEKVFELNLTQAISRPVRKVEF